MGTMLCSSWAILLVAPCWSSRELGLCSAGTNWANNNSEQATPLVNIKRFDLDEEAATEAWTMPAAS
jgi:hypothetical protein